MIDPAYLPDHFLGAVEVFGRGHHGLVVGGKISTPQGDVTVPDAAGRNTYYHRNPHHTAVTRTPEQQAFDAAHGYTWPADLILHQQKWLVCDMNGDVWEVIGGRQDDGLGGIGHAPVLRRFGLLAIAPATAPAEQISLTGGFLTADQLGWQAVKDEGGALGSYDIKHESTRFDGRSACFSIKLDTTGGKRFRAFVLVDIGFGQDGKPASASVTKALGYDEASGTTTIADNYATADVAVYDRDGGYLGAYTPTRRLDRRVTSFEVFFAEYDQGGTLQYCSGRYETVDRTDTTENYAYSASGNEVPDGNVMRFVGTETVSGSRSVVETYTAHSYVAFAGHVSTIYRRDDALTLSTTIHAQTTWTLDQGSYSGQPTGTGIHTTVGGQYTTGYGPSSSTTPVDSTDDNNGPLFVGESGLNGAAPPEPEWIDAWTVITHTATSGTPSDYFEATRTTNNLVAIRVNDLLVHGNIWWRHVSVGGEVDEFVSTSQYFAAYNPRTRQIHRSSVDNIGWV